MSTPTITSSISLSYKPQRQNYHRPFINPITFSKPISRNHLKQPKLRASAALNTTVSPKNTADISQIIRQFCAEGKLREAVDTLCGCKTEKIDVGTFCLVLQLCADRKSLHDGRKVHSVILSNSWQVETMLGAKLVFMYVSCGDLIMGRKIFDKMANEKVYLWNILINEYAKGGEFSEGVSLYHKMLEHSVVPNSYTFSCVLKCFSGLGSLEEGKLVHGLLLKLRLGMDTIVVNSLIGFYFKCGSVESAERLFDELADRDVVSWNSMISGYVSNGLPKKGIEVFKKMVSVGVMPNFTTITCVLTACSEIGEIKYSEMIHGYALKTRALKEVTCNNALLDMYSQCGDLDRANRVFDHAGDRDIVSWTSLIVAYARKGNSGAAVRLFHAMKHKGLKPDNVTVSTVLNACAASGLLDNGREVHDYVREKGMLSDLFVCNTLIDMYVKCGSVEDAQSVFSLMHIVDIFSWNTIIGGYVKNGLPNEALKKFREMQQQNKVKPDGITMSCILAACAILAGLDRGKEIHAYILRNGQFSDVYVANALVDMYIKSGALSLACKAFDMILTKDMISWTIMISGYCFHGHGSEATKCFNEMTLKGTKPNESSFTSILCGCGQSGLVDEGRGIFKMMKEVYNIEPKLEHYTCLVHLLANAGRLKEAYKFIEDMPLKPNAAVWGALLQGCRVHQNIKLAEEVAEHIFQLEPDNESNYLLMGDIYTEAKLWEKVKWLKDKVGYHGKKNQVCSWIEVNGKVQIFFAENVSLHPETKRIQQFQKKLKVKMQEQSFSSKTKYAVVDAEKLDREIAGCGHSEMSAMAYGVLTLAPGSTIRVTKNSKVCHECHEMAKFMSKSHHREIILRDSRRFHHFRDALCSCRG